MHVYLPTFFDTDLQHDAASDHIRASNAALPRLSSMGLPIHSLTVLQSACMQAGNRRWGSREGREDAAILQQTLVSEVAMKLGFPGAFPALGSRSGPDGRCIFFLSSSSHKLSWAVVCPSPSTATVSPSSLFHPARHSHMRRIGTHSHAVDGLCVLTSP